MKKIFTGALVALTFAAFAFAEELTANVSFENKISSDIVNVTKDERKYAGIKNQVTTEIETEKVDVGVSLITILDKNEDDDLALSDYEFDKAYIEFKPVDFASIDFRRKVFTPGSYLPIKDDNVGNGNIASDLALLFRPMENVTLSGGINVPSVFTNKSEVDERSDYNFGISYEMEIFSIGAAVRSAAHDFKYGIFGSFTGTEGLTLNVGYAYDDEFADVAGDLLTVGAVFEKSIFTVQFDLVTNFGDDGQDLYTALGLETAVGENWIVETQGTLKKDFDDSDNNHIIPELGFAYVNGNHKIRAGVAIDVNEDENVVSFPVYYKYSF